jgi:hypothetical protein
MRIYLQSRTTLALYEAAGPLTPSITQPEPVLPIVPGPSHRILL